MQDAPFAEPAMRRSWVVALCAMSALGALMAFVPLTNVLGYESSMVTGVGAGVATLWLTHRALGARSALQAQWGQAWGWYWRWALRLQVLVVPPLVLLCLNAARVANCDLTLGAMFWVLGPCFAVWISHTLMWGLGAWLKPTRWRIVWGLGLVIANALAMGLHIALEPPITGHQWWIGFMSGSIYDEALSVPTSLLWYRACNVAGVLALVLGLEGARLRRAGEGVKWRGWLMGALVCGLAWSGMTWQEQRFGVELDRQTIARELGGRLETEHFVIHYPQSERFSRRLALLAQDHEYRYEEMRAFFKTDPVATSGRKVRSFVYGDREQKGRLMGARRTLIAKIWLGEMHIMWDGYGDHLLAHELAHVFTMPFGRGPFKLSARAWVLPNMGLVEGIATAADNPPGDLTLHEASAAMRVMGIAPDIRGLVGAEGFWAQSSSKAYTLMGSFVLYLVQTHGIEPLKKAYPTADFEGAYGTSAHALVTQWEAYIDGITPRPEIMAQARARYTRPSIFGKMCARTLAELSRRVDLAMAGGNEALALRLQRDIVGFAPEAIAPQARLARVLFRARELEQLDALLGQLLARQDLSPLQRAQLLHLRADMRWFNTSFDAALEDYDACLEVGPSTATQRLLQVKRHALGLGPDARARARDYLFDRAPGPAGLYDVVRWEALTPEDGVSAYLVGRVLFGAQKWSDAAASFERAAARGLGSDVLRHENLFLWAQALFHVGSLDAALERMEQLGQTSDVRMQVLAREWTQRVAFARGGPVKWRVGNSQDALRR